MLGIINYVKTTRKNLQNLEAPKKTYAVAQSRGRMDLAELAQHMAEHTSPFTVGTISGVLQDLVKCVEHLLADGWIIDLGTLGTLKVVLKSLGVSESEVDEDTGEKPVFSEADIVGVLPKFVPGSGLQNLRDKVQLNQVASLEVQTTLRKKIKSQLVAGTYAPHVKPLVPNS